MRNPWIQGFLKSANGGVVGLVFHAHNNNLLIRCDVTLLLSPKLVTIPEKHWIGSHLATLGIEGERGWLGSI